MLEKSHSYKEIAIFNVIFPPLNAKGNCLTDFYYVVTLTVFFLGLCICTLRIQYNYYVCSVF